MKNATDHMNLLRLTLGAVMISFSGVWVKVSHVSPTVSAFYRVFIGGVVLLVLALIRREVKWQGKKNLLLTILCAIFFCLDLWFYHYSIYLVGPGLGTILPNFQVFILTAAGLLFFREKLRSTFFLSIPLAIAGLFFIVGIQWQGLLSTYRLGVFYGLIAAAFYAAFLLSLRNLQSKQAGESKAFVLMTVSLMTALLLAAEVWRSGDSFQIPDLQSLAALTALGVISQVVGWILITNAFPNVRASLSGLILLLQPALAFVWDVLFFNRPTTLLNWLGVLFVLGAIYMGTSSGNRH